MQNLERGEFYELPEEQQIGMCHRIMDRYETLKKNLELVLGHSHTTRIFQETNEQLLQLFVGLDKW
jgi:hypothetical protein